MEGEKEDADVVMRKEPSMDSSYSAKEEMDAKMNKKAVVDASYSSKDIDAKMNKEVVANVNSSGMMQVAVVMNKEAILDVNSYTKEEVDVEMQDVSSYAKEVDVEMNKEPFVDASSSAKEADGEMIKEAFADASSSVKEEVDLELKIAAASSPSVSDSGDASVHKSGPVRRRISGPTKRSSKGGWTEEEDRTLIKAVQFYNGKNWKKIAECFPGRSDVQCLHRWQKVLNPDLIKGPWTKEEDERIIELVAKYGSTRWSLIAQSLPGRIGKQCRERWHNHLNPSIKKDAWTTEEEVILIRAQQMYGNKWAEIARFLPGRADNSIKNHWNCSVKKKLDSYFASGLISQLPGTTNADFSNHLTKGGPVKAEAMKEISSSSISRDQKVDPRRGAEKSSIDSVSGSASLNRGPKRPSSQPVQIEYPKCLKDVNNPKPVTEKASSFQSPREVLNNSDSPNHTTFSRKPIDSASNRDTKFSHLPLYYKHGTSNGPSPKTPLKHVAFPVSSPSRDVGTCLPLETTDHDKQKNVALDASKKPSDGALVRNSLAARDVGLRCEGKRSHSSIQAGESSTVGEVVHKNEDPGMPFQSKHVNYGPLYYVPLQLMPGWDVPSGMCNILKTDNHFEQAQSPVWEMMSLSHHATPSSQVQCSSLNGTPESILRSAAKSFKNTPSILRKRGHEASKFSPLDSSKKASVSGKGLNGELRIDDRLESVHLGTNENSGSEAQNNTNLIGKKNFVTTQFSSKINPAALKSVERQLENLFEAELDDAKTTSSDRSNANSGLGTKVMALDKSNGSQASEGSPVRNHMQLGIGVVAAYD